MGQIVIFQDFRGGGIFVSSKGKLGSQAWGVRQEKLGEGLAEELVKGWRRVGEGLANGCRVSLHPPTWQFPKHPF